MAATAPTCRRWRRSCRPTTRPCSNDSGLDADGQVRAPTTWPCSPVPPWTIPDFRTLTKTFRYHFPGDRAAGRHAADVQDLHAEPAAAARLHGRRRRQDRVHLARAPHLLGRRDSRWSHPRRDAVPDPRADRDGREGAAHLGLRQPRQGHARRHARRPAPEAPPAPGAAPGGGAVGGGGTRRPARHHGRSIGRHRGLRVPRSRSSWSLVAVRGSCGCCACAQPAGRRTPARVTAPAADATPVAHPPTGPPACTAAVRASCARPGPSRRDGRRARDRPGRGRTAGAPRRPADRPPPAARRGGHARAVAPAANVADHHARPDAARAADAPVSR